MKTNLKEINSYTRQLDVTIAWDMIEKDYVDAICRGEGEIYFLQIVEKLEKNSAAKS